VLHPEHVSDLLAPLLPGATCRDEWELFDSTIIGTRGRPLDGVRLARIQALAVC